MKNKKPSIAILTDHFPPKEDGVTTRLLNMLPLLVDRGYRVKVFTPSSCLTTSSNWSHVPVFQCKGFKINALRNFPLARPSFHLFNEVKKFQPDLVHTIFNYSFFPIFNIWIKKKLKIPLLTSYHTDFPAYVKERFNINLKIFSKIERFFLDRNKVCLFTSKETMSQFSLHRCKIQGILPPGVNLDCFHPKQCSNTFRHSILKGQLEQKIVTYVGRLEKEKNIKILKIILQDPRVHLLIVGDGKEKTELCSYFKNTNTHFLGSLKGEKLAKIYASSDLTVLPSTTETLGLVLLEAMASGCPVIGANSGGIKEVIEHGKVGYKFNGENKKQLFSLSQEILYNKDLQFSMKREARQYAEKFSWKSSVDSLSSYYSKALEL